jgi:hypothetical protein
VPQGSVEALGVLNECIAINLLPGLSEIGCLPRQAGRVHIVYLAAS